MEIQQYLEDQIKRIEPQISAEAISKFLIFSRELKEWNLKFNLTSITDEKEIVIKHFIDSIALLKTNVVSRCETLLDAGTGAGFPSIPIALISTNKRFFLLESNNKKIGFLEHIKTKLDLNNVFIIPQRSEIMSSNKHYREKYDCIMSRALAKFPIALEISIALVKKQGLMVYYASQKQKQEIITSANIFEKLGCEIDSIYDYSLPEGQGEHSLVIVKKLWKTDMAYPRLFNKIKRNPL
jgi:16S rRNA (guanine527-N7)-methyltransferase